ncbi:beta-lactamase/transpeptidase-like protein [Mycena rosella]|uniref:Beta-lactamase/transpeptidase-like protein n=1 Tax=Mycena rosella TaxID=1033263 RepID=A0AAD7CDL9_MYCRO|nr:beta-lactamase/transpeptidase-like protein [Mycena rosella]
MHFLSIGTIVLSFGIYASAVENSTILSPKLDSFINNVLAEWNTAGGVAVAVVRMDAQGGWLVETKRLFDILATGLLVSNQSLTPQISWKTKLASIMPGWKLVDPVASSESTIMDLMSHRTGLPRHNYSYFVYNDTLPALIQRLKYLKPSAGFREIFQYNNMISLGLNSTTYSHATAAATGRMADGFGRTGRNQTVNPLDAGIPHVWPYFLDFTGGDGNTFSGPGGVLTTAVDAARWLQILLLNGQHPTTNATIIPPGVVQMVATGVTVLEGNADTPELSATVYGGGQMQSSYRGHGFHAQITRFPADGVGIAVLTNEDFGQFMKEVIKVFGLELVDWDSRIVAEVQEVELALAGTPGPANVPLPLPLTALQGRTETGGTGPTSRSCTALIARLNSTFPTELAAADLVWVWDRSFTTNYVSLTHFHGLLFNPTGNASAPLWMLDGTLQGNFAEFAAVKGEIAGFRISGGIWGSGDVDEPHGNSVEARSEVGFNVV